MKITLVEFVDRMRESLGGTAFWDIDDNNQIKIETRLYFSNGFVITEDELHNGKQA